MLMLCYRHINAKKYFTNILSQGINVYILDQKMKFYSLFESRSVFGSLNSNNKRTSFVAKLKLKLKNKKIAMELYSYVLYIYI